MLALGIINMVRLFDPHLIILTGGVLNSGDIIIDLINKYVKQHTWKFKHAKHPPILRAKVEDLAGMIGAAATAKTFIENTNLYS